MSIQEGDIGVDFVVTFIKASDGTPLDVSSATTMQIKLRPDEGTTKTKTATHVTDGSDGQVHYVSIDGDLVPGGVNWEIQPFVEGPTFIGHGHKSKFHVEEVL